ncbi:MAG TPA: cupin domain-containing protein [Stellaceae bacterium]|nr:cupin domain-containing protein [Stellaceae bacterium]
MKKRIDIAALESILGTLYPSPFDEPCRARARKRLGDAAGLTQFGVNLLTLPPGAWSSQRHWHDRSDEFVYVVSGEVVLVTDGGEEILRAGDAAGFKANDENGHHLQNRSGRDAQVLEIGTRIATDSAHYSDIDMMAPAGGKPARYTRRAGTPYPEKPRRGP